MFLSLWVKFFYIALKILVMRYILQFYLFPKMHIYIYMTIPGMFLESFIYHGLIF